MDTIQKTQAINIELSCFNKSNNNRKLSVSDTIKKLLKIKALLIMICFCEKSHEINWSKAILLNFWFIDLYEREEKNNQEKASNNKRCWFNQCASIYENEKYNGNRFNQI